MSELSHAKRWKSEIPDNALEEEQRGGKKSTKYLQFEFAFARKRNIFISTKQIKNENCFVFLPFESI